MSEADDLHNDLQGLQTTAYERLFQRLNKHCLAGNPPTVWLEGFKKAELTRAHEAGEQTPANVKAELVEAQYCCRALNQEAADLREQATKDQERIKTLGEQLKAKV